MAFIAIFHNIKIPVLIMTVLKIHDNKEICLVFSIFVEKKFNISLLIHLNFIVYSSYSYYTRISAHNKFNNKYTHQPKNVKSSVNASLSPTGVDEHVENSRSISTHKSTTTCMVHDKSLLFPVLLREWVFCSPGQIVLTGAYGASRN